MKRAILLRYRRSFAGCCVHRCFSAVPVSPSKQAGMMAMTGALTKSERPGGAHECRGFLRSASQASTGEPYEDARAKSPAELPIASNHDENAL